MLGAFLTQQQSWNFPGYYLTQTGDRIQFEWLMRTKVEATKLAHMAAKVDIPGFLPIPETMPAASLEEAPAPPPACRGHSGQEHQGRRGETLHLHA